MLDRTLTKINVKSKMEDEVYSPPGSGSFNLPSSPFMLKLGYGTGVSVYRYKRTPEKNGKVNSPWAVKKTHPKTSDNMKERLAVEASILKQIGRHPNIVEFRAFTGTVSGDLCLAMEDCQRSLMDMIEEKAFLEETFTSKQILKVAWSIAKALQFIHNDHKLLHGDIKSANVLVVGDFEKIKLCDFGVSLRLKDDLSGLRNEHDVYVGSQPWKPKEALTSGYITDKSDIFPFGLLLWEMLTLSVPHVDLLDESCLNSTIEDMTTGTDADSSSLIEDNEEYLNALGTRPRLPSEIIINEDYMPIIGLFYCCTDENPENRPNASIIIGALQPVIEERNITS